jgi:hypothetical protein
MRAHTLVFSILCFPGLSLLPGTTAAGEQISMDPARSLRQLGYATDTAQQILAATESESYFVRHQALAVLVERIGEDAIPTLKVFLADPHMRVRARSAHLLGTLGDKSGIDQMRRDLQEASPPNEVTRSSDPNDPNTTPDAQKAGDRDRFLWNALLVARVLAELGDYSGYELAARAAFESPQAAVRTDAILVLAETAKADKQTLSEKGIDPVSVLCEVAACEQRRVPFGILVSSVQKLRPERAIHILRNAKSNRHQSDLNRRVVEIALVKVKDKSRAPR